MANVNVKVKSSWNGGKLVVKVRQGARAGVEHAARIFVDECKRLILNTPKSGRIYGSHQASAPGEPPANWTGHLVKSFTTRIHTTGGLVTVTIGNSARYAGYLEFGTRKMAARPFLRVAYANKRAEMLAAISNSINGALK